MMADFWDQFPSISAPKTPIENSGVSGYGTPQTPGMPASAPQQASMGGSIGGWQDGQYYDFGMTPPGGWRPIDPFKGQPGNGPTLGTIGQQQPPIDPSRYDPSKSFDDYYRDYHAPDRNAVLRGYPGMDRWAHLHGGGGVQDTTTFHTLGSLGLDGQGSMWSSVGRAAQAARGGALAGGAGLGGALGGAFGGMFGGGGSRPSGPTSGLGLASILTPGGRSMQIPAAHLQEALKRGARQVGG